MVKALSGSVKLDASGFSFNNMSVAKKIGLGFGLVLATLLIVTGVLQFILNSTAEDFRTYRSAARQTLETGLEKSTLLEARLAVKGYLAGDGDAKIADANAKIDELKHELEESLAHMDEPQAIADLQSALTQVGEYKAALTTVASLQTRRNQLVDQLNQVGAQAEKKLTEVMDSALADGYLDITAAVAVSQRHLFLARLSTNGFFVDHQAAHLARARDELARFDAQSNLVQGFLVDPARLASLSEVRDLGRRYQGLIVQIEHTLGERNATVANELDRLGPTVSAFLTTEWEMSRALQNELGPQIADEISSGVNLALIFSAIGVVVGCVLAFLTGRMVSTPVKKMTEAMERLATGDTSMTIPHTGRTDEIGRMANAVQVFKESMQETEALRAAQEADKVKAEADRVALMNKLADEFQRSIGDIVEAVGLSASEMRETSDGLSKTARTAEERSSNVASAANAASSNVQTVAGAAEELSSSIAEIAQRASESTKVARTAVEEADKTNERVTGLVEAAEKIGEVINLITDIASQTNLLALNATIEAARAGEMGKGFAVVASEVKSLANQTTKATEDISAQIAAIQEATSLAAESISGIGSTIGRVEEIAVAIASAVEEQGAATTEIAQNVQLAARGTDEVSDNIAAVTAAATETGQAAHMTLDASNALSEQSTLLKQKVSEFVKSIRAA